MKRIILLTLLTACEIIDVPDTGTGTSLDIQTTGTASVETSSGSTSSGTTGDEFLPCTLAPGTPWGPCSMDVPCFDGFGNEGFCYKVTNDAPTCVPFCSGEACPEAACVPPRELKCGDHQGMELCFLACDEQNVCPLDTLICDVLGCVFS